MKLTKENISFIDNYLKNNNVIYFDIRIEMLDHIATALDAKMKNEGLNFYDAFKIFMINNKTELMKQNKTDGFGFNCLPKFGKFLIQPVQLIVFSSTYLIYYLFSQKYNSEQIISNTIYFILLMIITLTFYQWSYIGNFKKRRFFVIEQTGGILFLIYQTSYLLNSFFRFSKDEFSISKYIIVSFYVGLFLNYLIFHFSEITKFKKNNQFLFK
ncbi:hypothetical protein [Flavobacterium sp.]|uniref:hypothetical protein n=2 Tax=Flavobacterium sp. TaxID=239 RepID=UPI00404871C4